MSYREDIGGPETWNYEQPFINGEGKPILCDREGCRLGTYIVPEVGGAAVFPACTNCEFAASLGDVFNEAEPRFVPDAPEDFKVGAARVFDRNVDAARLAEVIRQGRPDTWEMIKDYSRK